MVARESCSYLFTELNLSPAVTECTSANLCKYLFYLVIDYGVIFLQNKVVFNFACFSLNFIHKCQYLPLQ